MKIHQLLDMPKLAAALADGLVKAQTHPTQPLTIYNYTAECQWKREWNDVTRTCRGLIVDDEGNVRARPWRKFFNLGEHEEGTFRPEAKCFVTDKMDGSLGISYVDDNDEVCIATRGSFTSDQALHATELLRAKYPHWRPVPGLTYLFEIIYPGNRIVVDYEGLDDLVLLDVLNIYTGRTQPFYIGYPGQDYDSWHGWTGPMVEPMPVSTLGEALALPPRPNAEGVVVTFDNGLMIKIKQDDYVALHRLVTGLNERRVWEHLSAGGTIEELAAALPEEFRPWVLGVAGGLMGAFLSTEAAAREDYLHVIDQMTEPTRKCFAELAKETDHPQLLFMLLDQKPIDEAVWKLLRPTGVTRQLLDVTEDTA